MNSILNYIRDRHAAIYRTVIAIITISIIVYLLPKQTKFKYDIESMRGKPWQYDNLIAPFDFGILKSTEHINSEKADLIKTAKAYFTLDNSVYDSKLEIFKAELTSATTQETNFNNELKIGTQILDSIYSRGIIEMNDVLENKPSDFTISIIENNIEQEKELKSFFTVKSASEFIVKRLNETKISTEFLVNALENALAQNILYDEETTNNFLQQSLDNISLTKGGIYNGQIIISKGEIVVPEKYEVLQSLKYEYEKQGQASGNIILLVIGQIIIVSLCIFIIIIFLSFFRKDIFTDNIQVTFIMFSLVLTVLMTQIPSAIEKTSIYILPFCILPIVIRAFFDTRLALFTHLVTTIILSFFAAERFHFIVIQLLAGIVAIFGIVNMRNRSQIFVSSLVVFLVYAITYFGLSIIAEGRIDTIPLIDYGWFAISAGLTLFSYPLIYVFEKTFGFISDVTLLELSDTNSPLLRELASKAPGTFQHSLQVANIAEELIFNIGGNTQLVRAGALYHDIGKMDMPMYFVENQAAGMNPHQEMAFEESASIIIGHVIRGIEKAKKYNLPDQVIDFIRTHHGTTTTAYFFRSFQKEHPDESIDENMFRYPGPIPFSKETAVLMMSDSVEAASRSLKIYDAESISNLVEKIIDTQIKENQFANADVTFKDITVIKKILKKKLMNIYHLRVEYPDAK